MENKHTRIPWQVTTDAKNEFFWVESLNVAELVASETTQANAELIVTAVNHHDELVEALKAAKSFIGKLRRSISVHPDCEENSEFEDYAFIAQTTEDNIEQVLSKLPKI